MTPERQADIELIWNAHRAWMPLWVVEVVSELLAEVRRLRRGDFTPEELHDLLRSDRRPEGADPIRVGPPYPGDKT